MWDNHVPFSPQVMAPPTIARRGQGVVRRSPPTEGHQVGDGGPDLQTSCCLVFPYGKRGQWYLMVFQGWSYSRIFIFLRDVCSYVTSKVD